MPLGITGVPCIWGGPALTQRGVSNLLASLVEESKAPVWMGRERPRGIYAPGKKAGGGLSLQKQLGAKRKKGSVMVRCEEGSEREREGQVAA